MVFIDPPYNVKISGHAGGLGTIQHPNFKMASGEMNEAQFTDFLAHAVTLLAAHSGEGSLHYILMDWRGLQPLLHATQHAYSELKNVCVWSKESGGMGSLYRSAHELVFVFKLPDRGFCLAGLAEPGRSLGLFEPESLSTQYRPDIGETRVE